MALSLHSSLTRKKTVFTPTDPQRVSLYVCGPTVYNHAHIGNFRPAVVFDQLFRMLRHQFGPAHVVYARNFTDIDDKIIAASQETGKSIGEITRHYATIYQTESTALNILPPTFEPRATNHIDNMIDLIERLLKNNIAYQAENHILFDITQFKDYGKLSNLNQDEMQAGARVEVAPYKRNTADFVLWKPSKDDEPGWQTPTVWGLSSKGRPGWHLECSAMIKKVLGETIDIHGGGQDLRFPHHENEIAQSQCAHDAPLARYWLHNGFLQMGSDKMSKSVGNVALVRDLLREWPGEVLRWALLSAHYRQPLEWSDTLLKQSRSQLDRFYRLLTDEENNNTSTEIDHSVIGNLEDDLNTPGAVAALHQLRDKASRATGKERKRLLVRLRNSGQLLGILHHKPDEWFKQSHDTDHNGLTEQQIDELIAERAAAKAEKNYGRADEIREQLISENIMIEDGADGTKWRRQ